MKHKQTLRTLVAGSMMLFGITAALASSHREAPLIANDPLADNTDLYAFVSPDNPNMVTIIANYVPLQLPHGGPNYYSFGENIRYEIHIDNDVSTTGDDIIYRFTFSKVNQDPTTFFNIRLGMENLKTTYTMERSIDGGASFQTVVSNGVVPPPNIGARSIEGGAGLNTTYAALMTGAISPATSGENVFCGSVDDPFFVDLGGIFDLGDAPRQMGMPKDGVACMNVSSIVIQIPISTLQKDGLGVGSAANILDGDFVIGVWANASRQMTRTLNANGTESYMGPWIQVSRLGMPLTNEAVIPIGFKDRWNALSPYSDLDSLGVYGNFFYNPELGLYMDDALFGGAVPAFSPLRIQRNSLQSFDFGNGNDGLFGLKGSPAVAGTALDDAIFGTLLLPAAASPRSVDLWPIFHTGVPNLAPYHLATGKMGNPLADGKPFINNFLPNGGDMLRLNMATPATPRNDPDFSSEGLIQAAVLGLTDPTYNGSTAIQFIPNMDGFPNGRRLEDDVTRIELQAVGGVVLAAIGLWYDDYTAGDPNPVTADLLNVITFSTGVEANDTTFQSSFPYEQMPWRGTGKCGGDEITYVQPAILPPTDTTTNTGPCADNALYLMFDLDDMGSEITYEVTMQGGGIVASGGPFNDVIGGYMTTDTLCLVDGCYSISIMDAMGDGITNGGYKLVDSNGSRIVDADGMFSSTSNPPGSFCVPIGDDRFIFSSCDKLDFLANGKIIASQDPAVAAEFGIGDQTDDGYQFWLFDPHGTYHRRVFISNANPQPGTAANETGPQYLRYGLLQTLPVPSNLLLNIRVRGRVNGVFQEFGAACQFKIDPAAATCPTTMLVDDPNSSFFSCGVTRDFGGSDHVSTYAAIGANLYQFEFVDPSSGFLRRITSTSSARLLNWVTVPLQAGVTYQVRTRLSFDNGANYCPWGNACDVTIGQVLRSPEIIAEVRSLDQSNTGELSIYPNPNREGVLYITYGNMENETQQITIDILDLYGKQVQSTSFSHEGRDLNTIMQLNGNIATGMYMVRVRINGTETIERLIVE